ncbi:MAG TPA: decarboxylating 6-phosphogluconate dehydrogenase, partial [Chthoniobacterales bacterium]
MQLGMIGLGRMGGNMARRLARAGHEVVVYDRSAEAVSALAQEGFGGAASLEALAQKLTPPRAVWVMVPAGGPTEQTVTALKGLLAPGDAVIDGGNSYYKDDVRRSRSLAEKGLDYLDVGTSGGVWGIERGYCLMIGGPAAAAQRLEPIFAALAPGRGTIEPTPGRPKAKVSSAEQGYLYCGPSGAGHFVKMVHNGIEYGIMQSYAEGFDIMRGAASEELAEGLRYDFDLAEVAEVWRRGSVVGS